MAARKTKKQVPQSVPMMAPEFVERFRLLVQATEEADPKTFNMGTFFSPPKSKKPTACGTPACVFGNFVARTDLQKEFVPVTKTTSRDCSPEMRLRLRRSPEMDLRANARLFNGEWARLGTAKVETELLEARCRYFGITRGEDAELFGGEGCGDAKTPDEAVSYIKAFVVARTQVGWNALRPSHQILDKVSNYRLGQLKILLGELSDDNEARKFWMGLLTDY